MAVNRRAIEVPRSGGLPPAISSAADAGLERGAAGIDDAKSRRTKPAPRSLSFQIVETEAHMAADISNPELWGFGVATLIFLLALAYAVWKAGWLSPREKARTDAATVEMQRHEGMR